MGIISSFIKEFDDDSQTTVSATDLRPQDILQKISINVGMTFVCS